MTFDKQPKGRRTAVESKSYGSCNHRIKDPQKNSCQDDVVDGNA